MILYREAGIAEVQGSMISACRVATLRAAMPPKE